MKDIKESDARPRLKSEDTYTSYILIGIDVLKRGITPRRRSISKSFFASIIDFEVLYREMHLTPSRYLIRVT